MGYIVIKRPRGGIPPVERFSVRESGITFSRPLSKRLGLDVRRKEAVISIEKETGALCFDFKDKGTYPGAFLISASTNPQGSTTCKIYCKKTIERYNIPFGLYHFVSQDGSIHKTDCIVKL